MTLSHLPKDRAEHILPLGALSIGPVFLILLAFLGPFISSPLYTYSGVGVGLGFSILPGPATIDPNIAITSFALGTRAALEALSGHLPLWNHYSGLGAPLLGEMQSAALFPPTLLLLLPNGQAVEHALLQWLAGIGTYLFFRRFGLSVTAAVVGGILFELNGVFATLRNAAFNPIAFLPWLLYGVEALRHNAAAKQSFRDRLPHVCLMAFMAAMSIYAGFPETTYLYSYLVVAWALYRCIGLVRGDALRLFGDLCTAAVLALLICAPLLSAFVSLLTQADVGIHGTLTTASQDKRTGILYLMPYLFGAFLAAPDPLLADLSISSGGYVGYAAVGLACAALAVPGHRAIKVLLVLWIVAALGTSHGWPGVFETVSMLPFMKIVVAGRYLNASWIFCVIFLAALLIDRMPRLSAAERIRCIVVLLAGVVFVTTAAAIAAQPALDAASREVPLSFIRSIELGLGTVAATIVAILTTSTLLRRIALGTMLIEAAGLFLFPFLAYPRTGDIDRDMIAYLRDNVGFQRVAKTEGYGLNANFGAAFGVPLLNYDDLPVPKRTIDYIRTHLDEHAGFIFLPEHPALAPEPLAERRRLFRDRLPAYAHAGVKYIMAPPDFYGQKPAPVIFRDEHPIFLTQDGMLEIESRRTDKTAIEVTAVTLRVSTYNNTTRGDIKVRLCVQDMCSDGTQAIKTANDGHLILVPLDTPLTLEADADYTLRIQKTEPTTLVVWSYPLEESAAPVRYVETPSAPKPGYGFDLSFFSASEPRPVYSSQAFALFALSGVRAYASAPDCDVKMISFDEMETSCTRSSQLTRLNVHMDGWHARVNGTPTPIALEDDTFQKIDLPQGDARVAFTYAPPGFGFGLAAAAVALIVIFAGFAFAAVPRFRRRRQKSADAAASSP